LGNSSNSSIPDTALVVMSTPLEMTSSDESGSRAYRKEAAGKELDGGARTFDHLGLSDVTGQDPWLST
jgi:hypothetical protein